jgi:hypothetical protein
MFVCVMLLVEIPVASWEIVLHISILAAFHLLRRQQELVTILTASVGILHSPFVLVMSCLPSRTNNYESDFTHCTEAQQTVRSAVPWLRLLAAGLPPRRPGFDPGSVHVGFVMDKVTLGQVFLRVLRFSPVSFIPPVRHY